MTELGEEERNITITQKIIACLFYFIIIFLFAIPSKVPDEENYQKQFWKYRAHVKP